MSSEKVFTSGLQGPRCLLVKVCDSVLSLLRLFCVSVTQSSISRRVVFKGGCVELQNEKEKVKGGMRDGQ